jgi:hypothetical protein
MCISVSTENRCANSGFTSRSALLSLWSNVFVMCKLGFYYCTLDLSSSTGWSVAAGATVPFTAFVTAVIASAMLLLTGFVA